MTFISDLPLIDYDFSVRDDESLIVLVPDLLTRVTLRMSDETLDNLTDEYVIREGESPEQVSYRLYGTPEFHWVIIYLNSITSLLEEWPMTDIQLDNFCAKKYPGTAADVFKTYELSGVELPHGSTILRLESQISSALNTANFWQVNVGDYVSSSSFNTFPRGTQIVSYSYNNTTGEYELVMSKPSTVEIKAPSPESPEYPKTFSLKFNSSIEKRYSVYYWEDDLGVIRDKETITDDVEWKTNTGTPTSLFETKGSNALAISYLEYEAMQNEKKRTIKVVKPEYIHTIASAIIKELKK